ncbi:hypothetical protein F5Y18DRAFT_174414 [Xylariaceae sp. FL1019]|nr:hypothetical protein F5Y18DRAFT_174414 [Xylariaceae sp. FL1019]
MESSPLIKAHDHAKAASAATHTADTTIAIDEHTKAAGEFANAAKNTTSVEALRTLRLLEQHHRRLTELLSAPLQQPNSSQASSNDNETQEAEKDDADASHEPAADSNEKSPPPVPTLPRQARYPSRDLGASIANNLASARGIRSKYRSPQPLSPSVSNMEAPGNNMEGASRKVASRSRMQDMLNSPASADRLAGLPEDTAVGESSNAPAVANDDGFSKWYSTFGSIINRISAPLAYAGLPLVTEEQPEEQVAPPPTETPAQRQRPRSRPPTSTSTEPDLKRLYSKAALRAVVRDGQSTNDSFYVVPTSGHTASYASILTFADKEKRRLGASAHGIRGSLPEDAEEDDFVDARESQMPHSPTLKKRAGKSAVDRDLSNMVEELYLENKSLKDMLDKLSKRLHAFESMSQNSGMRLAESMRLMRPGSPLSTGGSKSGTAEEMMAKELNELRHQNQVLMSQNEELEKSYTKARTNLRRYRERWDELKAGAKARRAGQTNSELTETGSASPSLA